MPDKPTLTLFYREGCHLCEVMLQALRGLQACHNFDLELQDIDRDPQLAQRYDEWVPVLLGGEREICHYHLDQVALEAFLATAPSGVPRE
ncbi:hypothetical protein MNBD_GAMMA15-1246 [hydrothermal vent metagenome]|uniref:Thioredoxin n=1 Tax=hydrothermal vent metagenome TaxID=652676 RepID=A0A3B0YRM0_9ZZZZ